jgi:hypothetical protein
MTFTVSFFRALVVIATKFTRKEEPATSSNQSFAVPHTFESLKGLNAEYWGRVGSGQLGWP